MMAEKVEEPGRGSPEPLVAGPADTEGTPRPLIVAKGGSDAKSPVAPILFVRRPKKKRGKRYSRGTKDFQRLQRALTKASYQLSKAGTDGLERFDRESRKSGRQRRDGAVIDALDNAALGLGESMREVSAVPLEVAKGINGRLLWRGAKYTARLVIPSALRR